MGPITSLDGPHPGSCTTMRDDYIHTKRVYTGQRRTRNRRQVYHNYIESVCAVLDLSCGRSDTCNRGPRMMRSRRSDYSQPRPQKLDLSRSLHPGKGETPIKYASPLLDAQSSTREARKGKCGACATHSKWHRAEPLKPDFPQIRSAIVSLPEKEHLAMCSERGPSRRAEYHMWPSYASIE